MEVKFKLCKSNSGTGHVSKCHVARDRMSHATVQPGRDSPWPGPGHDMHNSEQEQIARRASPIIKAFDMIAARHEMFD